MLFTLLNASEGGNGLVPSLPGNLLAFNMCTGWGPTEVSAEASAAGFRKSLQIFASSGDLGWKSRLITHTQSHTNRKIQFLLLCLLLPLAHSKESAEISYSSLQHQVNWNEQRHLISPYWELYTSKGAQNYYINLRAFFFFSFQFLKWLLYT